MSAHLELDHPLLGQALVFCGYALQLILGLTRQGVAQGASHLALGVLLDACPFHLHELVEGVVLRLWHIAHVCSLSAKCIYISSYAPECVEG